MGIKGLSRPGLWLRWQQHRETCICFPLAGLPEPDSNFYAGGSPIYLRRGGRLSVI